MRISGQRIKRTRFIQTDRFVIAVDVEMVIPVDDSSEPCYEAETIEHLKEIEERARQGDVDWLVQHGKVYEAIAA